MTPDEMGKEPCVEDRCRKMSAAQLLGPLRPAASICVHGHRFTLDELFPWKPAPKAEAQG